MPRRPLPPEARRVRVDLTLAPTTVEALDALATARATTRSALVERLVREAVDRINDDVCRQCFQLLSEGVPCKPDGFCSDTCERLYDEELVLAEAEREAAPKRRTVTR